jgi:flavin reductase (DIM6/NTAB) family NADH-FMN oxidoreductase RutF
MTLQSDDFREAMSRWASGVTIVACRDGGRVIATTVSSFISLSREPPLVLIALGANATILPFLQPGTRFGISVLAAAQRRLATIFADPFPVGASPFPAHGDPLIDGSLARLACSVSEIRPGGDHHIIVAELVDVVHLGDDPPLVRYRRAYHELTP